jgi:hypothetical protein
MTTFAAWGTTPLTHRRAHGFSAAVRECLLVVSLVAGLLWLGGTTLLPLANLRAHGRVYSLTQLHAQIARHPAAWVGPDCGDSCARRTVPLVESNGTPPTLCQSTHSADLECHGCTQAPTVRGKCEGQL